MKIRLGECVRFGVFKLALLLVLPSLTQAAQFNLNVVDGNGNPLPIDNGFRWILQEDQNFVSDPNAPAPLDEQLALGFHTSHHSLARTQGAATNPAAGQPLNGNSDGDSTTITLVRPGRYYLSVLPYSDYAMGGAPVTVVPNADDPGNSVDDITVVVHQFPIPTSQIAVYLFHDCFPLNGAPDLPEEQQQGPTGPCSPAEVDFSQFNIVVEEPAGKYGMAGGPLLQDAFGNPLGTTYDAGGNVLVAGDGVLRPNADGTLLIQNLAPGKYGIIAVPPTPAPGETGWAQTSTIEGSPVVDAWVKANEPPLFVEFGPPGPHVFLGFVKEHNTLSDGAALATVSGMITDMHMSRPISTEFFSGRPFPGCWIAVNENAAGPNRYAMPCNDDSSFSIPNVPAGSYEMRVFDKALDIVIASYTFTVDPTGTCNGGQSCDFGEVAVFNWFNRLTAYLFNDTDQDGFWDPDEIPVLAESGPVNIRWRDGTIYQSFPTDFGGAAPFDELFPFFHWMVAEVGFTAKKATGATIIVDDGGEVDTTTDAFPGYGELNPQAQSENGGAGWRTETGPVLTQAFQGFLGQTNVIHFGKAEYLTLDFSNFPPIYVGENGGISGIVFNTVTRAENDPEIAVAEEWEPGVPRVQVNLYADGDVDSPVLGEVAVFPAGTGDIDWNSDGIYQADDNVIDDVNGDLAVTLSDVDNYPLGWGDPGCVNSPAIPGNECNRGAEDVDRNDNGNFDLGDAIAVTWTDSWDDNQPTNCQGMNHLMSVGITDDRCFDGLRNFNQVRPGVFDGGYAFSEYDLGHLVMVNPAAAVKIQAFYDYVGSNVTKPVTLGLLPADYIVEAATPPGYKTLREHHKNVDFGDEYVPAPQALPPACVGPAQVVPALFSIATKDGSGDPLQIVPGITPADAAAPHAGEMRVVCDQKKIPLAGAQNAAADFFLVTDVPVAANISGTILNDLSAAFDLNSPNFAEKYAPPRLPVAFYDWDGNLVNRVYGDDYGRYNALVPSTFTANQPIPSGMSPNMLLTCMNDAGPIPNPLIGTDNPDNPGTPITADDVPETVVDPFFNSSFSQFCYTFQFMPGSTTYLDTPVVPLAAFTNPTSYPVDCAVPQRTPMIKSVENTTRGIGPIVVPGDEILVTSLGLEQVPNPEWDGVDSATRTIIRNRNFGTNPDTDGKLELVALDGTRISLPVTNSTWSATRITATVPSLSPGDYQVMVTRGRGVPEPVESEIGVTLTVGTLDAGELVGVRPNGASYAVINVPDDRPTIQDAIDIASPGDMIMVAPGEYNEMVIMWKPVKLQGWGAGAVTINARQVPTEKIEGWRARIEELIDGDLVNGEISLLPGQQAGMAGPFQALGASAFPTEEGAGIFVAGLATGPDRFGRFPNRGARIDGLTILGSNMSGGIVVNGYAQYLNIGNNLVTANAGFYGGGIRLGHPELTVSAPDGSLSYTDSVNDNVRIHHNQVLKNGGTRGAGGGISLYTGTDNYRVQNNRVCGNFTQGNGAGIAHSGLSNGGRIEHNKVLFNESFSQGSAVNGGGIFVGGQTPLETTGTLLLSEGSGNVVINDNRIHGNLAGAGDGGGIAIVSANGLDIVDSERPNGTYRSNRWYDVSVFNNMITNNVAGMAGALSIQDSVEVHVVNNTIANNDSTATVALAFTPGLSSQSNALPAGIVSRLHSPDMATLLESVPNLPANGGAGRRDEYQTFSDANLDNNIVFANRSFFWLNFDDPGTAAVETGLFPANCTTAPVGCDIAASADYSDDLAVLDGTVDSGEVMFVRNSLLTDNADNFAEYGLSNNIFTTDPEFVNPVFNEGKQGLFVEEPTVLQTAGAFDEGGNFIQVAFGPLTIVELGSVPNSRVFYDYHIGTGSPALDAAGNVGLGGDLGVDFDDDPRPNGGNNDIGADELLP
ncbi:MAG: hypothetical protein GY934_03880 [Gammaproteobacteria bacterium]|nr:hypothetical protein [Gammaproteobacteria bacterium]